MESLTENFLELDLFPTTKAKMYDKYSYEFISLVYFRINRDFPFIDHEDVPSAIIQYSYELSLDNITESKLSEEEVWN